MVDFLGVRRAAGLGEGKRVVPLELAVVLTRCSGRHLEALQWAREQSRPWVVWTCFAAARGGHLELLQWARENACPWDKWTCYAAEIGRHLEVLKWAREHDCPWDGGVTRRAGTCWWMCCNGRGRTAALDTSNRAKSLRAGFTLIL
jgi:hypothetical protein